MPNRQYVDRCQNGMGRIIAMFTLSIFAAIFFTVSPARAEAPRRVTLLVHGLTYAWEDQITTWGDRLEEPTEATAFSGMIGAMERGGHKFGGTIRPHAGEIDLPADLEDYEAIEDSVGANLFTLEFSSQAASEGLESKTAELDSALSELQAFTGADQITIVAHSAGGVIARAYLQEAIPEITNADNVDRLITIGTPHMGSRLAKMFGRLVGRRATSLSPDEEIFNSLNNELDLPRNVLFASIVVRGLGADARGDADDYLAFTDVDRLAALPPGYRIGGDQVVHVTSQNLALTQVAAEYEEETARPILSPLVRVADPEPADWCFLETKVHNAAPSDEGVQQIVLRLVADKTDHWDQGNANVIVARRRQQAKQAARDHLEQAALDLHPYNEVTTLQIETLTSDLSGGHEQTYAWKGTAKNRGMYFHCNAHTTEAQGRLRCTFDSFGRLTHCESIEATATELVDEDDSEKQPVEAGDDDRVVAKR